MFYPLRKCCACTPSVDMVISFSIREQERKMLVSKILCSNGVSSRVGHEMEILPLLLSVTPLSLPITSETTDLTCVLISTEGYGRSTLEFVMPLLSSVWFGAGPLALISVVSLLYSTVFISEISQSSGSMFHQVLLMIILEYAELFIFSQVRAACTLNLGTFKSLHRSFFLPCFLILIISIFWVNGEISVMAH